jgi:hypothetical protein
MTPDEQLALERAVVLAAGDRPMTPHPHGLAGRVLDALDDFALIAADRHAAPEAKRAAWYYAAALVDALKAEDRV